MDLTNINDIKQLLERHGFRFSKSLGQNFLIASWVPEQIAEAAGLDEKTGVLEIGPGIGCLTEKLSERAGGVVAVELDETLRPVLGETLAGCENVSLVFGDALKLNLRELTEEKLPGLRPVVCANLPYNVTTPLISSILRAELFDTVTVMIQKEVAERICARPGTADYGAFTLLVQRYAEPELLFTVPPGCFIPQPKVTSAVVRMKRRTEPPAEILDDDMLFRVIRAAFGMRRKTLTNALGTVSPRIGKAEIANILTDCGFAPGIRGEVLSIGDFAKISNAFCVFLNRNL